MMIKDSYKNRGDDEFVPDLKKYDYSKVEDIAGVEYKNAIIFTAVYILLHLFAKNILGHISFLWIASTTTLSVVIWGYFKKYFIATNDIVTSKWINWIVYAYIAYGLLSLFSIMCFDFETALEFSPKVFEKIVQVFIYLSFIPLILIFFSAIKINSANRRHSFPLKRIAFSSMFFIPLYMLLSVIEQMPIFSQAIYLLNILISLLQYVFGMEGDGAETFAQFQVGFYGNVILMIPYYFLLYHFYRANEDDATPDY